MQVTAMMQNQGNHEEPKNNKNRGCINKTKENFLFSTTN